jgi:hypothetical protein
MTKSGILPMSNELVKQRLKEFLSIYPPPLISMPSSMAACLPIPTYEAKDASNGKCVSVAGRAVVEGRPVKKPRPGSKNWNNRYKITCVNRGDTFLKGVTSVVLKLPGFVIMFFIVDKQRFIDGFCVQALFAIV